MRKTMQFTIMSDGDKSMSYHCKKYTSNILLCSLLSGWLQMLVSGVAICRLALLCGNRFGVPRLSWRALIMCINSMLSYVLCELICDTLCM